MTNSKNEIEIPGRLHPVLALLAFLPIITSILIVLTLAIDRVPPVPLILLLLAVLVCCIMVSWHALQILLGGMIIFSRDGLTISRLFGEKLYPWSEIEACKVMPATGTFGDDALVEIEDRVGVGLFLRNTGRQRAHDLDADVVICAGDKVDVQGMMRIAKRVDSALKRATGAAPRSRGLQGAPSGGRRQFQQRPAPSKGSTRRPARTGNGNGSVDPVAQFRSKLS